MRFIGDSIAKTDAKGRVFLPSTFRKQLERAGVTRLILRPDPFQRCLVLYTEAHWNEMLDEMRSRLNAWNGTHRAVMRQFVADAEEVEPDGNGRLLLTKRKMLYAGIEQEVRFLGVDDRIEIWDRATCEAELKAGEEMLGEKLQELMGGYPQTTNPLND